MGFKPFPVFGRGLARGLGRADDGGEHITPMAQRILAIKQSNLIGYWKLDETTGTTARDSSPTGANGSYAGTVTLNQGGIGDGSKAASFGGGRVSLATPIAALAAAFNPLKGTIFCWAKIANVGVWTDATSRFFFSLGADASNRVFLGKSNINNTLAASHRAGGTAKTFNPATSTLNYFSMALTWDKVADQAKCYFGGIQNGATQNGLGVWVGTLFTTFTAIADFDSAGSANAHSGLEAHVAAWNEVLTADENAIIGIL